jgi:hypothetical protein
LSDLSLSVFSDDIGSACVGIVNACRDADILNSDLRLENFIDPSARASSSEQPVAMIDFAQYRFRADGVDGLEWRKKKGAQTRKVR